MNQMPIKGEQLSKIPTLLPDLTAQCKPPTMCFGWVIGADEIEQLGRAKGQYMELTPVDYYEPEDPDRPQDVDAVFEYGVYEVRGEPYFSPEWTADGLLLLRPKRSCDLTINMLGVVLISRQTASPLDLTKEILCS